jgi:hypothetical protein
MVMVYGLIAVAVIAIAYYIFTRRNKRNMELNKGNNIDMTACGQEQLEEKVIIVRNGKSEEGILKMGQGLEVFDSSGKSIFNSSTLNFKRLGSFSVSGEAGSLVDNNIVGKNIVFFVENVEIVEDGDALYDVYPTNITVSGNTIKWDYQYYSSLAINQPSNWAGHYEEYARKGKQKVTFAYGWI